MIEVIHDDVGGIKAVCDYIVTKDNILDENGDTMFICDMEIVPAYRGNGMVRTVIRNILAKRPNLKTCSWFREYKYKGRPLKTYTREQFEKLIKEA